MNDCIRDQARELYRTVRILKARLGHKFQERARASTAREDCDELTFAQCNVLMAINEHEELSLKDLAEILHVSRPSASSMVDRLVEMGMVAREQSQLDRREVRIRLSDPGLAHFRNLEGLILECLSEILVKLGPVHSAQWCEVYARIHDIIEVDRALGTVQEQQKDRVG